MKNVGNLGKKEHFGFFFGIRKSWKKLKQVKNLAKIWKKVKFEKNLGKISNFLKKRENLGKSFKMLIFLKK